MSMKMGIAAAERCNDFGWHPHGRIDTTLVAEIAQHPRFGMGHAWSRSAEYNLTTAPERIYLVLTMEGGFEFTVDGEAVIAEPGSLIVLDGAVPTTARTLTETARFVWHLEPTMLNPAQSRFRFGEPISTGGTSVEALTTLTNALLQAPPPATELARHHLASSLENILVAVVEESGHRQHGTSHHREGLFMTALTVIGAHFRNPAFSVTRLARELSVSERTVHAAFTGMGTTPRREIERRRVTEAGQLAATATTISPADLAARSGFTSAQQLSRALARAQRDR
jgi:AraC-like DNA-binding protein